MLADDVLCNSIAQRQQENLTYSHVHNANKNNSSPEIHIFPTELLAVKSQLLTVFAGDQGGIITEVRLSERNPFIVPNFKLLLPMDAKN